MLRDNLVELIEPMRNSAGADLLALSIYLQRPASDDSLSCLENPRPEGAESSLTDNVTSPFSAEPRHSFGKTPAKTFACHVERKIHSMSIFQSLAQSAAGTVQVPDKRGVTRELRFTVAI